MKCFVFPYQRGITTLTLLILLSGLLSVIMLFNDDILRLNSALVSQRAIYVEHSFKLQKLSQAQKDQLCSTIPLQSTENSRFVEFDLKQFDDSLKHYIWCKRQALFKQAPRTSVNESTFTEFINELHLPLFQSVLSLPPTVLPKDRRDYFYWFDRNQTEWELKGNIYAVIVAEGDLNITGKGRISGAVITRGKLSKGADVQLAYRRATVAAVAQMYSRWIYAEKSWNDFKAH